jgi:stress responsive alpha/beta barrel protein
MVNHVVMFKFKSTAASAVRQAYIEELRSLGKKISEVRRLDVGENIVASPRAYDVVLIASFDDRQALDRYARHPEHQPVLQRTAQVCENVAVVDYLE